MFSWRRQSLLIINRVGFNLTFSFQQFMLTALNDFDVYFLANSTKLLDFKHSIVSIKN